MTQARPDPRALPALLVLGGVWGASFLFIKVIVGDISPPELVLGRLFFGMVTVRAFMAYRRLAVQVTPLLLAQVSLMALLGNVIPFTLVAWGEERIDSGLAAVLNSTMPIFTSVIAAAVLAEERFTPGRLAGLVLGFAGVVALTGSDVFHITDSNVLGQIAVIGASACYGLSAVYARTLLRGADPINLSMLQLTAGVLLMVPIVLVARGVPGYGSLSIEGLLSLVALGVFGTGLGYVAYLWLIEHIGSVRASLVTYIVPVVGLLLGWIVLGESIGLNIVLGTALIVGGVAVVMRGQAPRRARVSAEVPAAAE